MEIHQEEDGLTVLPDREAAVRETDRQDPKTAAAVVQETDPDRKMMAAAVQETDRQDPKMMAAAAQDILRERKAQELCRRQDRSRE